MSLCPLSPIVNLVVYGIIYATKGKRWRVARRGCRPLIWWGTWEDYGFYHPLGGLWILSFLGMIMTVLKSIIHRHYSPCLLIKSALLYKNGFATEEEIHSLAGGENWFATVERQIRSHPYREIDSSIQEWNTPTSSRGIMVFLPSKSKLDATRGPEVGVFHSCILLSIPLLALGPSGTLSKSIPNSPKQ